MIIKNILGNWRKIQNTFFFYFCPKSLQNFNYPGKWEPVDRHPLTFFPTTISYVRLDQPRSLYCSSFHLSIFWSQRSPPTLSSGTWACDSLVYNCQYHIQLLKLINNPVQKAVLCKTLLWKGWYAFYHGASGKTGATANATHFGDIRVKWLLKCLKKQQRLLGVFDSMRMSQG